ncbi:MAG TPA: protein kinase [Candidatus Sulfopaludibacter sp.]|nr:protein kinase [Candidatus Sulfopaludibacter sp.]
MTPARWGRIREVFAGARERPQSDRAAYLDAACASDAELRAEVERLLAEDSGSLVSPLRRREYRPGDTLAHYRIEGKLGEGGMGLVYQARDTRLDRAVALKLSKAPFSARFEREARAIAALNHPHICTLYDVGPDYLAMEFVQGKPLRGPLPIEEALRLGGQLLDALESAHRRGIVHRDLKPANILVTKTGLKVLDFGLAKMEAWPAGRETVTQAGTILGTPHYMSPEQAQGKEVDARSDLFSFGLVFYEMLTGRRAFEADHPASVIAAILEREPAGLETIAPAGVQRALRRCLAKDPADRWASAGDVKAALECGVEPAASAPRPARRVWLAWAAAAALALGLGSWAWLRHAERPADSRVFRLEIRPPGEFPILGDTGLAVSPDGSAVVFRPQWPFRLYLRSLGSSENRELPGTEGAYNPFWSPDGRWVGFFANGKLQKLDLHGGPPAILADLGPRMGEPPGGAWNREGTILFAAGRAAPLMRISSGGGTPAAVTKLDSGHQETGHGWPSFLPDGKHFLFTAYAAQPAAGGIYLGSLDSPRVTRLLPDQSNAQYAAPGYVLFSRDGALMAQPFDTRALQFTGEAFPVAEDVSPASARPAPFSASAGVLAYRTALKYCLRWYNRKGDATGEFGPPGVSDFAIAPDGHAVAAERVVDGGHDVWLIDPIRGTNLRLTFGGGANVSPRWSPDNRQIAFLRKTDGQPTSIRRVSVTGAEGELVARLDGIVLVDQWTADGKYVIFDRDVTGHREVWAAPPDGGKPFAVAAGPFNCLYGQVSPDGKWIAYHSNESGRPEIYVQRFPPGSERWPVSTSGGNTALWAAGGRELVYRADAKEWAVEIRTAGAKLEPGMPQKLFDGPSGWMSMDAAPDGRKFLFAVPSADSLRQPLTVVVNWQSALKK